MFEFRSSTASTEVAATAFGPDAEMHILTHEGDDSIEVMGNGVRIATGDGDDAIKADAMYLSAAVAGAGDDLACTSTPSRSATSLGGDGNDNVDAWGNFVGTVDGGGRRRHAEGRRQPDLVTSRAATATTM